MKITLDINDIDYGALVEVFLPMVHDKLAEKDVTGPAILAKIAGMPPSIAGKMIDMLPQETKDELVVYLINSNKGKIAELLQNTLANKGIELRIDDIEIEK